MNKNIVGLKLAITYALFVLLATAVNIFIQAIFVRIYTGLLQIPMSIITAISIGLLIKYTLDKRLVFQKEPSS